MSWRIKDWNEIYENNRTRGLKKLEWVPIPNKMDGDGYTQLLDHPNGAAHFGAWIALVEIASKCEVRGTLHRDAGRPHDAATLARVSRIPASLFTEAIPRLMEIGWIEEVTVREMREIQETRQTGAEIPHEGAGIPHDDAPRDAPAHTRERTPKNGTERNGMEWKGNERNGSGSLPPGIPATSPPPGPEPPNRKLRSSGPVEIPRKAMDQHRAPTTQTLTAERLRVMRNTLHGYMGMHGTEFERNVQPPDDPVVLKCLTAVGNASMELVAAHLRDLFVNGNQSPRHANGPKSYPWFVPVLTARFRDGPGAASKPNAAPQSKSEPVGARQ